VIIHNFEFTNVAFISRSQTRIIRTSEVSEKCSKRIEQVCRKYQGDIPPLMIRKVRECVKFASICGKKYNRIG
jgi:hypothetical protein